MEGFNCCEIWVPYLQMSPLYVECHSKLFVESAKLEVMPLLPCIPTLGDSKSSSEQQRPFACFQLMTAIHNKHYGHLQAPFLGWPHLSQLIISFGGFRYHRASSCTGDLDLGRRAVVDWLGEELLPSVVPDGDGEGMWMRDWYGLLVLIDILE